MVKDLSLIVCCTGCTDPYAGIAHSNSYIFKKPIRNLLLPSYVYLKSNYSIIIVPLFCCTSLI